MAVRVGRLVIALSGYVSPKLIYSGGLASVSLSMLTAIFEEVDSLG